MEEIRPNLKLKGFESGYGLRYASGIVLPFIGNNDEKAVSMVLLLPDEGKTIADVLNELKNLSGNAHENGFDLLMKDMIELNYSQVSMPPFKERLKYELRDFFADEMGLRTAFDSKKYTKMKEDGELIIRKVIHDSFIEVNEVGAEAAAVTVVVGGRSMAQIPSKFIADRPFIYIIKDDSTNAILFMGTIQNPSDEGIKE